MPDDICSTAVSDLSAEYSRKAEAYSAHWAPLLRSFSIRLLDHLPVAGAQCVIEVACGTGGLLPDLQAITGGSVQLVGIDRAYGMLQIARGRTSVPLAAMDAHRLAFTPGSFDIAICLFALHHMPDPECALTEIRGLLRPGGTLGIAVWGQHREHPGINIWSEELDAIGAPDEPRSPVVNNQAALETVEKLSAVIRSAGFTNVNCLCVRMTHQWTAAGIMAWQAGCGAPERRLRNLDPESRRTCLDRIEARLSQLTELELIWRPEVVFATAEA